MGFYKVNFSGFAIVKADSPEEAESTYDIEDLYMETSVDNTEEVDEYHISDYM